MRANSSHSNFNDDRLRDHQRQQERLKAMAASVDKVQTISADRLIENLLKDPFKEPPKAPFSVHEADISNTELPLWLQCESDGVPAHYKYLWSLVQSTKDVADTQKVSQLLLTSGLQVDILGFIWNLANKKIPGQLTKQEFYIVLALVSLAQSGYTFTNLSVLKLMTMPSIPVLQVGYQKHFTPQFNTLQNVETITFNPSKESISSTALQSKPFVNLFESEKGKGDLISSVEKPLSSDFTISSINQKRNSEGGIITNNTVSKTAESFVVDQSRESLKNTNFPYIGSSPTAELEDDFSAFQSVSTDNNEQKDDVNVSSVDSKDDFTEFQSAVTEHLDPFETVVISQKREVPKIPFPKTFTGKFTNLKSAVLKISPETEKKLKVLSTSESLSSLPESKISSSNKVSTSLSVLGSNHGIGSRLANHSVRLDTKMERPKYKHHKSNLNSISPISSNSEDEIILGVKPRNLESVIPKCNPKNSSTCKTFILKETKIRNDEAVSVLPLQPNTNELESAGKNTRQIEIPMLGTFNETVLPTQSKSQLPAVDLISVQEDKYSALRNIDSEFNQEKNSVKEANDDFGDFLSADIPSSSETEFPAVFTQSVASIDDSATLKDIEKDDWGDWNFNAEPSSMLNSLHTDLEGPQTSTVADLKESPTFTAKSDLFDAFSSLAITEESSNYTSGPDLFLQEQPDNFSSDLKIDNMGEVVIFNEKNEKLDDLSSQSQLGQASGTQPGNEFWEFLSSNVTSQNTDASQQNSLPSLDLKITPIDESEQEVVWKKCLDSCHSLIQEGYEIFNNISSKCVLDEVFAAPNTEQYLNNLNIAFQISKRVSQNFSTFPPVQEDLEKLWVRLQDLCFEYNIKLKHDEDNCSEGKIRCNICLRRIGYNVINKGNNTYHPSCANLWINCVEPILPSLV